MNNLVCFDTSATLWGIFNLSIAPQFLLYAYVPVIILALFLGFFILRQKTAFSLPNKLFFALTVVYSLHLGNEAIQWIAIPADLIYFSWSLIVLFYTLITLLLVFFSLTYVSKKQISAPTLIFTGILLLPVMILLPTNINIKYLDLSQCYGEIGFLHTYIFGVMYFAVAVLTLLLIKHRKNTESSIVILGSIFTILILLFADKISENFELFQFNLFGPVGMVAFLLGISYLITERRALGSKLHASTALTAIITLLTVSLIFVVDENLAKLTVLFTAFLSLIGGFLLVKAVDREIRQREEIQKLAKGLEKANARLRELDKQKSEFVSVASHQLRSPLAAIRGYASMIVEGSYGKVEAKMVEPLSRIAESAKLMNESVEDFLSVSRIEGGNMKYEMADFSLAELTENVTDDLRPEGFKKGLLLLFKSSLTTKGTVHADKGKTQQILHNLINNALKYTPKGTITVHIHENLKEKKVYVDIIDTGIGMSEDTIDSLFSKFTRAKNANEVNIKGTGLGLFVAREMARAMQGEVSAHSMGEGQGSRFELVLPLIV